jgi:lysozyme family protein
MKNISNIATIIILLVLFDTVSCKRQDDFLNVKSSNNLVTPSTLSDYQGVLDNSSVMNFGYPALGMVAADNRSVDDNSFGDLSQWEINTYLWKKDLFSGLGSINDWDYPYKIVENSNIVLDGISGINTNANNLLTYNNIKGSALFFRAFAFYNLSQIFCKPYIPSSAATDLGIPIRTTSDVNAKSVRASVKDTYNQMINDLKLAVSLLPSTAQNLMRPSKIAANALLAKIYLSMGDYINAGLYASSALSQNSALMDFNNFDPTNKRPFAFYSNNLGTLNPEMIIWAQALTYPSVAARWDGLIDDSFYNSYDDNDLRKVTLYLSSGNTHLFKGSYCQSGNFSGLATNELYLIRAESNARQGNVTAALSDLNALLSKRYKAGTFIPFTAANADDALVIILQERRKELPFTAQLRWEDLRRLNQDPRFATTLTRTSNGVTYTLPPNDPKYVLSIPDNEIQLSGIQQNLR